MKRFRASTWSALSFVTLCATSLTLSAQSVAPHVMDLGSVPPSEVTRLQFRSGGHVLGFKPEGYVVAGLDNLLKVNFVGARSVVPVAGYEAGLSHAVTPPTARGLKAPPLGEVFYRDLWPGIDLRYDSGDGILRSTYILAPGAKPAAIRLDYNVPITLVEKAGAALQFANGTLSESAPIAWQDIEGRRQPIEVAFQQHGNGEIGFAVGNYDPALPLIIDPTLTWNTFLGGAGADVGRAIATDASGNVYVIGFSTATWGTPVQGHSGGSDVFVARLDASSGARAWHTFLGAGSFDDGSGIAIDAAGNVYVTGFSRNTWGTPVRPHNGPNVEDAFVARLDAASGAVVWNTFLGGAGTEYGEGIATDAAGNVYVTGQIVGPSAYASRLNAASGALVWQISLPGFGFDIATDTAGNVYVTGRSDGTWGTPVRPHGGAQDAFVARLDASEGAVVWNTFLGGEGGDQGFGIATDAAGNVFVTGFSNSTWGTPVRPHGGVEDAFVARLNAASGVLAWHTFLGGVGNDRGLGITIEAGGDVFASGRSGGAWGTPLRPHSIGNDAQIARLSASGGVLLWHTFLGGVGDDQGSGIATDAAGYVYVSGDSTATWGNPIRPHIGSGNDAFAARLASEVIFSDGFE